MPWLTPDLPTPTTFFCRRLRIPNNLTFIGAVSGALVLLIREYNWEEFGTMTPAEAAEAMSQMFYDFINGEDWCMVGVIVPYATTTPPAHTLPCDGAIYNRVDYPVLYAALNPAFIIDADTFKTPDMVERFPLGASLSPTGDYPVGASGGEVAHTLIIGEMPEHTHSEITAIPAVINGGLEAPASAAVPSTGLTGYNGGGNPHNNMPPFTALRYAIICE